jgi:hypothetical protein
MLLADFCRFERTRISYQLSFLLVFLGKRWSFIKAPKVAPEIRSPSIPGRLAVRTEKTIRIPLKIDLAILFWTIDHCIAFKHRKCFSPRYQTDSIIMGQP